MMQLRRLPRPAPGESPPLGQELHKSTAILETSGPLAAEKREHSQRIDDQSGYVYENKGAPLKICVQSGNVGGNKGSYWLIEIPFGAGGASGELGHLVL